MRITVGRNVSGHTCQTMIKVGEENSLQKCGYVLYGVLASYQKKICM